MIAAGARWKVGAVYKINIQGKSWLKDDSNPYITTDIPSILQSKVSSLISMNSRTWEGHGMMILFKTCLILEIKIVFIIFL